MNFLDLTGKMVGITMTDSNLKSFMSLHPKFPLRQGGIYHAFGKVVGHALLAGAPLGRQAEASGRSPALRA